MILGYTGVLGDLGGVLAGLRVFGGFGGREAEGKARDF